MGETYALPTPEQAAADADKLMHVIRDIVAENPDHPRLGRRMKEAVELRDRLAARIAQHDAATTLSGRISQKIHMETLVGSLDRLAVQAVMSAANPTGDPEKHMNSDEASAEVSRRLETS